ncbi:MAG: twin-arginine translocation signal domain-containing protein, partial [Gammaproteobacteria bacterium]|nr:twin-arginine translocation signal domain-containing protein [Gammaproteobacteria bacterium]
MTTENNRLTRRSFIKRTLLAAGVACAMGAVSTSAVAEIGYPEKEDLKFGFI